MKRITLPLLFVSLVAVAAEQKLPTPSPPPATPKRPASSELHGVKVSEDYRWLEDSASPEVKAWSAAQNQRARAYLAALPSVGAVRARLAEIMKAKTRAWFELDWRGGQLFAMKYEPPKQRPFLVVRASASTGDERVLADPSLIDPTNKTAIDWYVPSLDGKRVALSLSKNGTEHGDLHILDVASGKELPDVIEHVQNGTAGGSAVFTADGSGIFYTRYPRAGEPHAAEPDFWQQVWFHKFGTPASADVYCVGKELPRIAEIKLSSTDDGKWVLADVANGDGGDHAFWLRAPDGKWSELSKFADKLVDGAFGIGADRSIYFVSLAGAPLGKVVRVPLATPSLAKAKTVVPAGDGAIEHVAATKSRLWVVDVQGGPSRLRSFALDGKDARTVPTPPVSGVGGPARLDGDDVLISVRTYVEPAAWWRYAPSLKAPERTALVATSPIDFSGVEVSRDTATSKDGTKVPFTILRKKGTPRDGHNATVLTGYGGFNLSLSPGFDPTMMVYLEQGVVYAIANLRGGGEFGEAWHKAGMLTHKQNVFDDFIAVAQKLVDDKWTEPRRLGIYGGSNGGLLMGAVVTQRPELFRAVVSRVGIYDMLRTELSSNGQFNVTEYGSVKDPEQFKALYAYSPYHHVVDGTKYPAMLLTSGEFDPRVDPLQSRKMVARLQAASTSGLPILLRSNQAGHGLDTALDERIEEGAAIRAFLFAQLGVDYKPVK